MISVPGQRRLQRQRPDRHRPRPPTPGWGSIPIAFANGDGTWKITNGPAADFIPDWAHQPGVRLAPSDFHG